MQVWPYSIFLSHQEMRNNELSSSCLELTLSNQLVMSFPQEPHNSSKHHHELSTFFFFKFVIIAEVWRHLFFWEMEMICSFSLTAFSEGNAFLLFSSHRVPHLGSFLCNSLRTRFPDVSSIGIWHQLAQAAVSISAARRWSGLPKPELISRKWRQLLHTSSVRFTPGHSTWRPPTPLLCGF